MDDADYFLSLPDQVLLDEVFPRLSYREISRLCRVHSRFNAICEIDQLWRGKVQLDYPENYRYKPKRLTWREFYRLLVGSRLILFYLGGKVMDQVRYNPDDLSLTVTRLRRGFKQAGDGQVIFVDEGITPISSVRFPSEDVIVYNSDFSVEKVVIIQGSNEIINEDAVFRSLTKDGQLLYGIVTRNELYLYPRRSDELGLSCYELPLYTLADILGTLNIVTFRAANQREKAIEMLNSHLLDGINTGQERRRLVDLIINPNVQQMTLEELYERREFLNSVKDELCRIISKTLKAQGRVLYY